MAGLDARRGEAAFGVTVKLGKLPPQFRAHTPHFANYLASPAAVLPTIPDELDWNDLLPEDLGMFQNDKYGCCGFASQAHALQTWATQRCSLFQCSDDDVLTAYSSCTGFRKDDPSTDNGVVLVNALDHWKNEGIAGHKIDGYVLVDHRNLVHVRAAAYLFGGVYLGAALPLSAQDTSTPWRGRTGILDGADSYGSLGGHCMWVPSYALKDGVTFVTWAKRQRADWQWWLNYVDECYAVLAEDWVDLIGLSAPNGFDYKTLSSDLRTIASR